jgi:hypothetical protein
MKKKLVLLGLLSYAMAVNGSGLGGSQLQYQDAVLITAIAVAVYAYHTCDSVAKYAEVAIKHYGSMAIAGGAGLAVFYSDQFNNMIPEQLLVSQSFNALNKILPYWFGLVVAGATYSNFCDRYDEWFNPKKKESKKKEPAVVVSVN